MDLFFLCNNRICKLRILPDESIHSLRNPQHGAFEDVVNRDMDVDRLNWLIARQTNMILQNASLCRKMVCSTSMAMH